MMIGQDIAAMAAWGTLAGLAGLGVNVFHPHHVALSARSGDDDPCVGCQRIYEIDLEMAKTLWDLDTHLFVDARPPARYEMGHIARSVNLPADQYDERYPHVRAELERKGAVIVYSSCEECESCRTVGERLYDEGFRDLYIFCAGWDWQARGYPLEADR